MKSFFSKCWEKFCKISWNNPSEQITFLETTKRPWQQNQPKIQTWWWKGVNVNVLCLFCLFFFVCFFSVYSNVNVLCLFTTKVVCLFEIQSTPITRPNIQIVHAPFWKYFSPNSWINFRLFLVPAHVSILIRETIHIKTYWSYMSLDVMLLIVLRPKL